MKKLTTLLTLAATMALTMTSYGQVKIWFTPPDSITNGCYTAFSLYWGTTNDASPLYYVGQCPAYDDNNQVKPATNYWWMMTQTNLPVQFKVWGQSSGLVSGAPTNTGFSAAYWITLPTNNVPVTNGPIIILIEPPDASKFRQQQ